MPRCCLPNLALHSSKNLAVSPGKLPCRLILPVFTSRTLSHFCFSVTVRISKITLDGCYPLLVLIAHMMPSTECSDFPPNARSVGRSFDLLGASRYYHILGLLSMSRVDKSPVFRADFVPICQALLQCVLVLISGFCKPFWFNVIVT